MNCPRLPAVPGTAVSKIEPSWFRNLNECLEFAMTHPRGDGRTIINDAGGSLRSVRSNDADTAGSGMDYQGSFRVSIETDDGGNPEKIKIGEGWVNVNGKIFHTEETSVGLNAGILCVTSSIGNDAGIEEPTFEFVKQNIDEKHYPIAIISGGDDQYDVIQMPVTVAVLLLVAPCALAKAAQKAAAEQ